MYFCNEIFFFKTYSFRFELIHFIAFSKTFQQKYYLNPLKSSKMIPEKDLQSLFSNIESILKSNSILLSQLDWAGSRIDDLSTVFIKTGKNVKKSKHFFLHF